MKNRRYFNKSVKDLEEIFQNNKSDGAICQDILHELGFRSTARALDLKNQIAATSGSEKSSSKPQSSIKREAEKARTPPPSISDLFEPDVGPTKSIPRPIHSPGPKPPIANDPQDILRAWTALEVLSPQGYRRETDLTGGDRSRIAQLDEGDLPWEVGEKSRPKKRLFYELILGTINLGPAVEALLKLYSDNRPDAPSVNRRSPIASVLLDKEGRPLEEDTSFAISSFAWGVPIALQGDLKLLADWPAKERELIKAFRDQLIKRDKDGEILPLTKSHIRALYTHLVEALQLSGHDIAPPHFAIRRYEFFASKVPPEPSLLNSFFLEDLATARELARTSELPHALRFYLGVSSPGERTDLLQDHAGLQHLLQPALTPLGRWPGNGRFPLALLQQAAVNGTTGGLKETGILSVNGPPGTGKTTLLRDIVAARIVERASVMAEYKNPKTAFTPSNQVLQRSGAKITLHRLDDRLKGFEMVVASSNNKAVENVSAELPAMNAVAADAPELRYFKSISDSVLDRETWGMIAAVLGNSSNRFQFSQSFWRDEENGLSTYLNHVAGVPQFVVEPQQGATPKKRPRKIISAEQPPNNQREALSSWEKARASFLEALTVSRTTQARLQEIHKELVRLSQIAAEISETGIRISDLQQSIKETEARLPKVLEKTEQAEAVVQNAVDGLTYHREIRPGFFARLFRTKAARSWLLEYEKLSELHQVHEENAQKCKAASDQLNRNLSNQKSQLEKTTTHLKDLERNYQNLSEQVSRVCGDPQESPHFYFRYESIGCYAMA